jgi:inorganic pyrophosphatase
MNLEKLPTFTKKEEIRCVVESPARSPAKLKYDPEVKAFVMGKPLLKGLTYPYDWGFIPSTLGSDGDPLDVLIIHDIPTHPGLVIPCQLIGVLEITQTEGGKSERNDRILAVPATAKREAEINHVDDLCERLRDEVEYFFKATAELDGVKLEIHGWKGPKAARRLIDEGRALFAARE